MGTRPACRLQLRARPQARCVRRRVCRPSLLDVGTCAKCGGPYGSVRGTPLRTQNDHLDLVDPDPDPTESVVPVVDDTLVRRDEADDGGSEAVPVGDSEEGLSDPELPLRVCLMSDWRRLEKMTKMLRRFGVSSVLSAHGRPR